jgi:hypothetical protein
LEKVSDLDDVSLMPSSILQAWFLFAKLEDLDVAIPLSHSACIAWLLLRVMTILRLSRPKLPCSQTLIAYNSLKYTAIKVANG